MAKVIPFKADNHALFEFAERAREAGDLEKCVRYLNRCESANPEDAKCSMLLADVYFEMAQYGIAKKKYFDAMLLGDDSDDLYFGLSMCMVAEGDLEGAEYYLAEIDDELVAEMAESVFQQNAPMFSDDFAYEPKLRLVKPKTEDYENYLLESAEYELHNGNFSGAIEFLLKIDKFSKNYNDALKLLTVCYTALNKLEKAAELTEMQVSKNTPDVSTLCNYYSILKAQERDDEAAKIMEKLREANFEKSEDLLKGMQIFCLAGEHEKLLELSNLILSRQPFQTETAIIKAVALYNLGKEEEAATSLKRFIAIYPKLTVAEQYLQYFKERPKDIVYTLGAPYPVMLINTALLNVLLTLKKAEFLERVKDDLGLIKWGFENLHAPEAEKLAAKCGKCFDKCLIDALLPVLTDVKAETSIKHQILFILLKHTKISRFRLIVENIYKDLNIPRPTFGKLPKIFKEAFYISAAEMAIIDIEPQEMIFTLCDNMEYICDIYQEDNVQIMDEMNSVRTMAAVLSYMSERDLEFFDEQAFFEDYNVDRKLFDDYLEKIFKEV